MSPTCGPAPLLDVFLSEAWRGQSACLENHFKLDLLGVVQTQMQMLLGRPSMG